MICATTRTSLTRFLATGNYWENSSASQNEKFHINTCDYITGYDHHLHLKSCDPDLKSYKKQVSMTKKCHNHRPQTNPWHRVEETQNTNSNLSAITQLKEGNQLSLSQGDDCKTRKYIRYCITKQGLKRTRPHKQWEQYLTMTHQQ